MDALTGINNEFNTLDNKIIDSFAGEKKQLKIDRSIVHKKYDKNVFIGDVAQLKHDLYQCQMVIDKCHDFFFEHYIDHVPGLLMLESARQMGTAICHLYYNIDSNYHFVIDHLNISFKNFNELNKDIFIRTLIAADTKNATRQVFKGKSYIVQNKNIIAEVESTWRCLHRKISNKGSEPINSSCSEYKGL